MTFRSPNGRTNVSLAGRPRRVRRLVNAGYRGDGQGDYKKTTTMVRANETERFQRHQRKVVASVSRTRKRVTV
jgi:hypothetical protein